MHGRLGKSAKGEPDTAFVWRWIDTSMGLRQAETAFASRNLDVPIARQVEIEAGLRDRSAAVRNEAISGLIRYREEIGDVRSLAEPLLNDPSRRVRERAAFLLRWAAAESLSLERCRRKIAAAGGDLLKAQAAAPSAAFGLQARSAPPGREAQCGGAAAGAAFPPASKAWRRASISRGRSAGFVSPATRHLSSLRARFSLSFWLSSSDWCAR